jgi:1-pyrroline-5-carboxylate dehydrogenase
VSIVMQEALRLFHACGLPTADVDFIHSDGPVMNDLLLQVKPRNTLFTGCVGSLAAAEMRGRGD